MPGEQEEKPFKPLKADIRTPGEYARAIQSLREFSELDITTLETIEDLSAETSLVGEDVRRVVLASDHAKKEKFSFQYWATGEINDAARGKLEEIHNARGTVEIREYGENYLLRVASNNQNTFIQAYQVAGGKQYSDYYIMLPVGKDIGVTGDPIIDRFSIYAVDRRSGTDVGWSPARKPFNKEVQQGFTRLLQEAVKEVLSIARPPMETSVPIK